MIKVMLFDPAISGIREGGEELITAWASDKNSLIWVNTQNEDSEKESRLMEEFGIHRHAIADAQRDRHPPKIEAFAGNSFMLLKALDSTSESIDYRTIQLAIFVGDRFMLTRSSGVSRSIEKIWADVRNGDIAPDAPRAVLALRLCRAVSDRFLPALLMVEDRLEEMESEMLAQPTDKLLAELVRQKGDLRKMLRILQYHAQVFSTPNSDMPVELSSHRHELIDVVDQLDRHLSLARLYYDLTDDLINGYLSLSAHRLNQIMQTLTIVTVIFVPITFMAGIYGMNFDYIPELKFQFGYFTLLGTMLLVVMGIMTFLYRRGWLVTRGSIDEQQR